MEEEATILPSMQFATSVTRKAITLEIVPPNLNNAEVGLDTLDNSPNLLSDIMIKALGLQVIPDCEDVFD